MGEMPLTSGWRSPASSSSRVQGAPLSRSPAPPRRPRAPPPMATQQVAPRPPRALPRRPPPRPVVIGVGDSTSREGPAPRRSLLPPPMTMSSPALPRGESPCCSRNWYSSLSCSRRSRRRILLSFLRVARSCSRHCAGNRSGSGRWRVRPRDVHCHPLLKNNHQDNASAPQETMEGREACSPPRRWGA
jgi:hypothetical protein